MSYGRIMYTRSRRRRSILRLADCSDHISVYRGRFTWNATTDANKRLHLCAYVWGEGGAYISILIMYMQISYASCIACVCVCMCVCVFVCASHIYVLLSRGHILMNVTKRLYNMLVT